MNVLVFGFYGEGPRDYGFLLPVMQRTLQKMLPDVDVLDIALDNLAMGGLSQIEKIQRVAEHTQGYGLVIFHLDADGPDTRRAYRERFEPGYRAIQSAQQGPYTPIVPVIPVRMTDAWLLVDFEAFQKVVGTKLDAEALGFVTHPQQVESLPKPKAMFVEAVYKARQGRRRVSLEDIYRPMALRLNLERLEQVPAYQEFLERLKAELTSLHYL